MAHFWERLFGWRRQDDDDKEHNPEEYGRDVPFTTTKGDMRRAPYREKITRWKNRVEQIFIGAASGAAGGVVVLYLQHLLDW